EGHGHGRGRGRAPQPHVASRKNRRRGDEDRRRHQDRGRPFRVPSVKRALLLALIALAACRREAPRPAAPPAEAVVDDSAERASLTNIAHGATIISRTGESFLGLAADAVIDGNPTTFWANPTGDFPQSVVIGLPARARIERVGLRTPAQRYTANYVQFEGS